MRNLFVLFLLLIISCNNKSNQINNLPEDSVKINYKNKINYFKINSINSHNNKSSISIYDEKGVLLIKKTFSKICKIDNLRFIENLKDNILYFDGEKIILKDNCKLE